MSLFSLQPDSVSGALHASLVVVMPIYNEEQNIQHVVHEWEGVLGGLGIDYQMLLLNDGSKDGTLEKLKEIECRLSERVVIVDKWNTGHGATCRLGYEIATNSSCDWVLQIDSDGQCDACFFQAFWKQRDLAQAVLGVRVRRDDGWMRTWTSRICRYLSSLVTGLNVPDPNVPYRLIRRETLRSCLQHIPSNFNIHNVALSSVLYMTRTPEIVRVPIEFRDRAGGTNSLDVPKVMSWGAAMIFELFQLKRELKGKLCR